MAGAKRAQEGLSLRRAFPPATVDGSALSGERRSSTRAVSSNDANQEPDTFTRTRSMRTMEISPETVLPDAADFFNFTRGQFVKDEQHELAQRHRTFNVSELARRAARAVQADRCLSIKKYPDGMYNRVLLLSMDNGKEVVAKIPNPNSGQPHFTTASEVATMKFVSTPQSVHTASSHI